VWVRYPSQIETTFQPTHPPGGQPAQAQVRDVSQGGISLVVDRPFEPGAMLCIELPTIVKGTSTTVLACVIHLRAERPGRYVVGCTFSSELTEAELATFGAKRARPEPGDRRSWVRYPCEVTATYSLVSGDEQPSRPAQVLNISAGGVALSVREPLETGTLINVVLRAARGPFTRTILACVVHVTKTADGGVAAGCNFIRELTQDELRALR
jgi:c-di-GMP-binding flagellar brake protein YcgR